MRPGTERRRGPPRQWGARALVAVAGLMAVIPAASAEGLTGEAHLVVLPSRDRAAQRSLLQTMVYAEYAITREASVYGVGFHDQEFRSATLGLARTVGHWQAGFGLGRAAFDERSHRVVNPWAYYDDGRLSAYLHYEDYRTEGAHSHFGRGFVLRQFGRWSAGVHAEKHFGVGPRVQVQVTQNLRAWLVVPVVERPRVGPMALMLGMAVGF